MEKNKRIIIELYGLPGSGKSTLKNELVKKISEENLNIYEYSDYLNFMSKGHKNAIIKGLFTKNGLFFAVHSFCFLLKHKLLFKNDIAKRMFFCLSFMAFYKVKRENDAIIIMDEGIIQGVISALFTNTCNGMDFLWLAKTMQREKITPVFMQISKDVANERIISRNTKNHGRCDAIEDNDERCYVLEQEGKNFNLFYKKLTDISIPNYTMDTVAINIHKILTKDLS